MDTSRYEEHAFRGELESLPTLYLDDVSAIPFLVGIAGVEEYQHRARLRAGDRDLFAAVTPPAEGYEEYCRDKLKLGEPELVRAEPLGSPLAVAQASAEGAALGRIAERARAAGGLRIHPYMSIEPVWTLARRVGSEAAVPVEVIGPPPPVTWIANDKRRFSELVERVLGADWLVRTAVARKPAELARRLLELSEEYPRVGLKRTRCASAMGNEVFVSEELRAKGARGVETSVRAFLDRTEWDGSEDVLAVAWEETALSPSTQTWIPPRGKAPPRIDGVFEQILEGPERVFVGSRPADVPRAVRTRLTEASLRVASALQELGYVGRCSFDFLVVGDVHRDPRIRFTECNGRWGGTSIPMSLVDRLIEGPRPPYRAQDFVHPALAGVSFQEVLERAGQAVYDRNTGKGRFVFYNVGPLARSGKLDVIALGETQPEAEWALTEELPRLLLPDARGAKRRAPRADR